MSNGYAKYREVLRSNGKVRWGDAKYSYARVMLLGGVWSSNGKAECGWVLFINGFVLWGKVEFSNG